MSAFSPPWKDIDDTRPGTPYVVDSDGWGWFALFIVLTIPFLAIAGVVVGFSALICAHPIVSLLCYVVLTLVIGGAFYARAAIRHRICGVIATVLTMAPLGMGVALYAIPYVMLPVYVTPFLIEEEPSKIGFTKQNRTKYPLYPIINEAKVRILQYYA